MTFRALLALVFTTLVAACATPSTRLPTTNQYGESVASDQIQRSTFPTGRLVPHHAALAQIDSIESKLNPAANRVCRYLAEDECNWDIHYTDDPIINAYASGESRIIINRGIVQATRNESELAFVIAHEMAHHIADHLSESAQNALVGGLIMGALSIYATNGSYDPVASQRLVNDATSLGMTIGARSYSKQQELEADYLAAYITTLAGYDLSTAGQILVTLAKADNIGVSRFKNFIGTHPSGPKRVAAWRLVEREIASSSTRLPVKNAPLSFKRQRCSLHQLCLHYETYSKRPKLYG